MATKINLNLRGNVWQYSFSLNGKQHRGSTGIKEPSTEHPANRAKALLFAEKVLKHLERGKVPFLPEQETARTLFDRYLARKVADGLSESSQRNYQNYIKRFFELFPDDVKLSLIGPDDMEDWKAFLLSCPVRGKEIIGNKGNALFTPKERGKTTAKRIARRERERAKNAGKTKTLSKKSVKESMVFVASVCKFYDLTNPLKNVKLPEKTIIEKQEEINSKCYTSEQLATLLETAKGHNRELYWWLMFLAHTGCRIGEAQGIRAKDINFEDGTVFVIGDKRDIGRTINLEPITVEETTNDKGEVEETITRDAYHSPLFALSMLWRIAEKHRGQPLGPDDTLYFRYRRWFGKRLETVISMAGLPRITPHGLRHSFVTLAMAQGHDLGAIAKVAGHKSVITTYSTYGHLSKDVRIKLDIE